MARGAMKTWMGCAVALALLTACGGGGGSAPAASGGSGSSGTTAPSNSAPTISGTPTLAVERESFSFTPTASDPNGDTLTFSSSSLPDWVNLNAATGEIAGTPRFSDLGIYPDAVLTVSDGVLSSSLSFDLTVDVNPLEAALRTGDIKALPNAAPIIAALDAILSENRDKYNDALAQILNLNSDGSSKADSLSSISWDPTHDAALLRSRFGQNIPLLTSNAAAASGDTAREETLGIIGETDTARYMVLGSNPFRQLYRGQTVNDDMQTFMRNSLSWLTERSDLNAAPFNVVIAQSGQNFYFPDQIANRQWLRDIYDDQAVVNSPRACNGAALAGCLNAKPDLLIISQYMETGQDASQIAGAVNAAMQNGVPVLYMHYDGHYGALAQALFPLFHVDYVEDNYWPKLQIDRADPRGAFGALPRDAAQVKALIEKLDTDGFSFDLTECEDRNCPESSAIHDEFYAPAQSLRAQFRNLDAARTRIFDVTAESQMHRYEKLLVLLADMYRKDVVFPMDKATTPRRDFLRSYFADHVIYNSRDIAPVQADMGSFSRSDFSHVMPAGKAVTLTAKPNFRSTGAYAIPGQSFTVTRTDNSDVKTKVFINSIRDSAHHEFDDNGYVRPIYPQSVSVPLLPGEPVSMTSVYGGPIQISFDAKDVDVTLSFENVGSHAYWNGPEDDASFTAALAANDYDWAELVTPAFEVHSLTERMVDSLEDEKWSSAANMAAGTNRYMSNLPHVLAGFQGPGIDVVDEIHDFATDNGLTIDTLDRVKHMNAEIATCGYGCSGNPYDAYWSFDPLGHGDIHELGHGLERSRFRFSGWELHAVTNPYSYYSKSHYGRDRGADLSVLGCQSLPFETLFNRVQQSRNDSDPFAYMQAQNNGSWNQSVAMTIQFMMAAQAEGVLENGWHVLARLHILDRAFNRADNNDADWLAMRDGLGFEGLTRDQARALSNDDWMLIAYTHATGRDMRNLLTVWGMGFSDLASDLVAAKGLPPMPVNFYLANGADYCTGLDKQVVPIDGAQAWPF